MQGLLAAVLQQSSTPTQPTDLTPPAIPPALPLPQATSTAAAGMAAVSTAAGAQQQQQTVAGAEDAAAASSGDQLLHNQIKDSWLVKTLLQQQQPGSKTKLGVCAGTTRPCACHASFVVMGTPLCIPFCSPCCMQAANHAATHAAYKAQPMVHSCSRVGLIFQLHPRLKTQT